jgi:hypothetical protein
MPKTGRGSHPGDRERTAERQASAMKLRVAGASFRQIGEQLRVSAMQAHRDCMVALNEVVAQRNEDAAALRVIELERLDRMTMALWPSASKGSAEHVRALVRVSERRCRLLGLDAAVSQRIELNGGPLPLTVTPVVPLAHLTTGQLVAELERVRAALTMPPMQPGLMSVAVPVPAAPLTPAEAYKAELAARGNGQPH